MTTGEKIRKARISNNYTQKKLSELIDISYKTLSDYERGRLNPDLPILEKICKILQLPASYFLDDFYSDKTESLTDCVARLMLSPKDLQMIKNFYALNQEEQENISFLIENMTKKSQG